MCQTPDDTFRLGVSHSPIERHPKSSGANGWRLPAGAPRCDDSVASRCPPRNGAIEGELPEKDPVMRAPLCGNTKDWVFSRPAIAQTSTLPMAYRADLVAIKPDQPSMRTASLTGSRTS